MKYLNRVLWVAIPLLMTSCLFPDDESIEESTITENIIEEELQAEQMSTDLVGTWMTQSVDYSSTTTYTSDSIVTSESISGTGTELNYSITFTAEPNDVIGEGIFSLELINGQGAIQISRGHNIVSSATWTYQDDMLTLDAGGKIIEATVTNLSSDVLSINIVTETTDNFNDILTVKSTNTTYEFTKQ